MNLGESIRQLLPPVDPRTPQQIDRDIDDEFAFHLAMLEDAERAAGADAEAAKANARKRFGDAAKWRKRCRNIALKERVMLQRINFALTILLMLVVIGVGVQVWLTQRHNTLALQEITSQMTQMKYAGETETGSTVGGQDKSERVDDRSDRVTPSKDRAWQRLIGVWKLHPGRERLLPETMRLLEIRKRPSDSGWTSTIHPGADDTKIELSLADVPPGRKSPHSIEAIVYDHGYKRLPVTVDDGWRIDEADTLLLDLRAVLELESERPLSDEIRNAVQVPLQYDRVTQSLSTTNETGPPDVVHIFGSVDSPGVHSFPQSGAATLQWVLDQAGVAESEGGVARVIMMKSNGPSATIDYDLSELRDPSFPPVPLESDSVVQVMADEGSDKEQPARTSKPQAE